MAIVAQGCLGFVLRVPLLAAWRWTFPDERPVQWPAASCRIRKYDGAELRELHAFLLACVCEHTYVYEAWLRGRRGGEA